MYLANLFKSRRGDPGMVEWTRLTRNDQTPFTQGIGQGKNYTGNYTTYMVQRDNLAHNSFLTFMQDMKLSYLYPAFTS